MNKTKQLVQGALFVAIYGVFFLVSRYMGGILESFCFFILPIPLAIFTCLYGWKKAMVPYVAVAFIGALINPISTIFYVLTANVLGIVYGQMIRSNKKASTRLVACIITSTIVNFLTMFVFAGLFDYSIQEEISLIFKYIFKLFGFSSDNTHLMDLLISTSIPVFIFVIGMIEGYLIDVASSMIFKRLKFIDQLTKSILFILLPRWLAFVFMAVGGLVAITFFEFISTDSQAMIIFGGIIFDVFCMLALTFCLQGIVTSVIFCARKNIKYVFVAGYFIGIVCIPLYFLAGMSIIGFVAVISDYHERLLYNK